MQQQKKRNTFAGSIGFVLAAAGSAVGLGNIWRFPYLAAKDGGGMFLAIYLLLALTFGFTLLSSELAIGRKTRSSALTAYGKIKSGFGFLGVLASVVPFIILPYYCAIGGWVLKYFLIYVTGSGAEATAAGYFNAFISSTTEPLVISMAFVLAVSLIVIMGVNKGIEASSKIMMPVLFLLIAGIAVFSLTLSHTDASGATRTGLQGFKILLIPSFKGLTLRSFFTILLDAMGQLFYSISVAMGIMVTYGSYVNEKADLGKSINQIEICDTIVAFLAAVMIIPAVYTFMGKEALDASGPSLMFISLPKVFAAMGAAGHVVGALFFLMVLFAALTSAVSIMETLVASVIDRFHISRTRSTVIIAVLNAALAAMVCLGYNVLYFDVLLPNGSHAQLLDIMDYVSNSLLMPLVAIGTCILIGWAVKPKTVVDEIERNGRFSRKGLYVVMVRYIAPALLALLLLKSVGIIRFI